MTLSQMIDLFSSQSLTSGKQDPVIYRTWRVSGILSHGTPEFSLTRIEPGKVGSEYHMTRGHIHREPIGESYFGISGAGGLIARRKNDVRWYPLHRGNVVQMPAGWAHRTVNCGQEPLIFSGQYPMPFNSDYEEVRRDGMGIRVFEDDQARPRFAVDRAVRFHDYSR